MIGPKDPSSKLGSFYREFRSEIKFVMTFFIGILIAFLLVFNDTVARNVVHPITVAETYVASKVLHTIGFPNKQDGTHIQGVNGNHFRMEVRNNCNGIYESIVFLMAFIAIQIPWRKKIGWMSLGFCVFHIINELRLVTLFIVGSRYSSETFVFFHETFWNYALIILTLAIFIFCAHRVSKATVPGSAQEASAS